LQQYTYETLLGKKVRVELLESVLNGSTRCVLQIQIAESLFYDQDKLLPNSSIERWVL